MPNKYDAILGEYREEDGGGSSAWGSITGTLSDQTDLQTALDGKVDENAPITGATKTKVTYDAKGLVTAGADATTADIADSSNKRYVTDAQQTVINNTSGTNTGDQDLSTYQLEPSEGAFVDGDKTKLDGIETGAEVNNISDANATDLTDGGATTLHTHAGGSATKVVQYSTAGDGNSLPSSAIGSDGDFLMEASTNSGNPPAFWGPKTGGVWEYSKVRAISPRSLDGISRKFNSFGSPQQGRALPQLPSMAIAFKNWDASYPNLTPTTSNMNPWNYVLGVASSTGSTTSGSGLKATSTAESAALAYMIKGSIFASPTPISMSAVAVISTRPTEATSYAGVCIASYASGFSSQYIGGYIAVCTNDNRLYLGTVQSSIITLLVQSDTNQVTAGDKISIERRGNLLEVVLYDSAGIQKTFLVGGVTREALKATITGQVSNNYFPGYASGSGVYFKGTTVALLDDFYGAA